MAIKKPTNHWFVGFCLLTVLFCPVSSAERQALEPIHSRNIIKLQITDNHTQFGIHSKSKSFWISFAIPNIGCIFGCRISNAPNYEYQT